MIHQMETPMDVVAIQKCIPHRPPFLLVDRVIEYSPNERIVAYKHISSSEPYLAGHFPDNPIMPGVLIVEGLAQAAAVLGHFSIEGGCKKCYLTEIQSTRFRRQVIPGDCLRFELLVKRMRKPFFWFEGTAAVDSEIAAHVKFSAYMS